MDRSEKRYFKVYLNSHPSKHQQLYVRLFDLISDAKEYDESSITTKLKDESIRFSVLKHRLFEKVLDALEDYQKKNDVAIQLRSKLNKSGILIDKGLARAARIQLDRTIDEAAQHGLYGVAIAGLKMKLRLLSPMHTEINDLEELYAMNEQFSECISSSQLEWQAFSLRAQTFISMSGQPRKEARTSLDGMLERYEELEKELTEVPHSPESVFVFHHGAAALAFFQEEHDRSRYHIEKALAIMGPDPDWLKAFPNIRARIQANAVYLGLKKGDPAYAKRIIERMLAEQAERGDLGAKGAAILLQSIVFYSNSSGDTGFHEDMKRLEPLYTEGRGALDPFVRASIDYGYALLYQKAGKRAEALKAVNLILFSEDMKRDVDIYTKALVLANILYIEADDREWLTHSSRSLKRYLQARNRISAVEESLLRYISSLRSSKNRNMDIQATQVFINRMEVLRAEPEHQNRFEYFDFLEWARVRMDDLTGPGLTLVA